MIRSMWVGGAAALLLVGCAGTPERFFTLRPAAVVGGGAAGASSMATSGDGGFGVVVGPVGVPAWLDRPQWVVRDGDARLQVLEQQRWAQPLRGDIAQAVADQLNLAMPVAGMVAVAESGALPPARAPALRVQIDVLRFESMTVPAAAIDDRLQWSVACTAWGAKVKPRSGVFSSAANAAPTTAPSATVYDQLAAAHADAVREASRVIGDALRDLAPRCLGAAGTTTH